MRRRLIASVDRWGPGALSIVTLVGVAVILWVNETAYSNRLGQAEGELRAVRSQLQARARIEAQYLQQLNELRKEVNGTYNWMVAVYERGSARGWDMPPLPKQVQQQRQSEENQGKKEGKRKSGT